MTNFFLLAASVAAAVATPALARDARPADTATEAAQPVTAAQRPAARGARKYCVVDTITGSRIAQKTCRTRDEWMRDGFDPLASDGN